MGLGRGFASGFLMGVQGAKGGIDAYYKAQDREEEQKLKDELKSIGEAKPEEFSTAPATPNDDDGNAMPAVKGIKFLGKTFNQAPTEAEIDSARTAAMAGVMMKRNPAEGIRLKQMAQQGKLTDLQISQAQRTGKREDKADADTAALEAIDKDVGDWTSKRLANPDGTVREMSMDDQLASSQYRVSKLVQAGKLTEANALAKDNMSMAANKIQLQTAERNEALAKTAAAVAQGDLSTLAGFYDKYVPDGARITNVVTDPKTGKITIERERVDGTPLAPKVAKDANEVLAGLKTFQDPMALYNFSQSEFQRTLHEKADKRADQQLQLSKNADGRAGARDAREQRESDAKVAASLALFKEQNPNATPAQLEAAKNGILAPSTPGSGKYNVEMGDVTSALGTPAVDARGRPAVDPLTGRQSVNRNVQEEQKFFQWMRDNNITDTNKGLALYMGQKQAAPQSIATDPRAIAIRDDKAMTPEQKREKLKALGYQ